MDNKIIQQFSRNNDEVVRVSLGSYKNRDYIDIRVFFTDKSTGELKPTKKGLTLLTTLVPELKSALHKCEAEIKTLH